MEQIVKDITGLVGGTPLLEAARFGQARGLSARLLCKMCIRDSFHVGAVGEGDVVVHGQAADDFHIVAAVDGGAQL